MNTVAVSRGVTNPIKILFLLWLFALVIRVLFVLFFAFEDRMYDSSLADQYTYLDIAENLVNGQGYMLNRDMFVADAHTSPFASLSWVSDFPHLPTWRR